MTEEIGLPWAAGFAIRDSRTSSGLFRNAANRRVVHDFLSSPEVYWGHGRSQAVIDRQISSALICFGVFKLTEIDSDEAELAETPSLVAFARIVGDGERFAYLAEVFTLPEYRGRGFGRRIILAALTESGDPSSDDAVSRDSTQWRWILHATKAKDIYLRLGFQNTNIIYELAPGVLTPSSSSN
ncbi:hypothetical protein B0H19DRAFT_409778 [Mycena capillaripes]|nr:hypothetical protein B0H19DRAFT_409778 [Mycena capillaripes]